ncbi:MAG TPA: hypothetical protein VJV78_22645 [Polyangiales bacterium]|nr:hypothetical protein [Polyangiales bacterium]
MSAEPPLTAAGNAGMSSLAAGSSGAPAVVVLDEDARVSPDAQPITCGSTRNASHRPLELLV